MHDPSISSYSDYVAYINAIRKERAHDNREWLLMRTRKAKIWAHKFMQKHAKESPEAYSEWLNK